MAKIYKLISKGKIIMPGFDGTGPRGNGPMSGWGRGFCTIPKGIFDKDPLRRFGRGLGMMGRGLGRGMGFGRRFRNRNRWGWKDREF
jgi:hypothetical protein